MAKVLDCYLKQLWFGSWYRLVGDVVLVSAVMSGRLNCSLGGCFPENPRLCLIEQVCQGVT